VGRLNQAAVLGALLAMCSTSSAGSAAAAASGSFGCARAQVNGVVAALKYDPAHVQQQACRTLSSDAGHTALALALRDGPASADGEASFDLDLLIVDRKGALLRRLKLDKAYSSDAVRFASLRIDTGRYDVAPGMRAFGVRAGHANNSRSNGYNSDSIALFIDNGKQLKQVLGGLEMNRDSGEWDLLCAGRFTQRRRTLDLGLGTSNGMRDLIVTSVTVETVNEPDGKDCKSRKGEPDITRYTLRYDGQQYQIPKVVQDW
jgi:hypothetical protein